jgi:hypothetical protein
MNASPQAGTWIPHTATNPNTGETYKSHYSSTRAYSGTKSLYSSFTGTTGYDDFQSFEVNISGASKVIQQFDFWFSGPSGASSGQYKVLFNVGTPGTPNYAPSLYSVGASGWWYTALSTEVTNTNGTLYQTSWTTTPTMNAWHTLRFQGKQSSGNGALDGSVEIWLDNSKIFGRTGIITRDFASSTWAKCAFFHGHTNMSTPSETYIDNPYVINSWARVVVSPNATWNESMLQDIQRPLSWGTTSIQCVLHKAASRSWNDLYLYVIDSNGVANQNGYNLIP